MGTPTDACAAMVGRRLLSSAIRSNDDNDWPAHSLILSLHDLVAVSLSIYGAQLALYRFGRLSSNLHQTESNVDLTETFMDWFEQSCGIL